MDSRGIPIVATQKHQTTPRRATIYSGNHTPRRNNDIPSSPFINLRNEHSLLEAYDSFTDACFQSQFNHSLVSDCFNVRDLFRADLFPSFNELPAYSSIRKRSFTVETEEDDDEEDMLSNSENFKKPRIPMLSSPSRSMTPMDDDDDDEDNLTMHLMDSYPGNKAELHSFQHELEFFESSNNTSNSIDQARDTIDMRAQTDKIEHVEPIAQDKMQLDETETKEEVEAESMIIDPVEPSLDTQNKQIDGTLPLNKANLVEPQDIAHNIASAELEIEPKQEYPPVTIGNPDTHLPPNAQEQIIPNQEASNTSNHTNSEIALPEANAFLSKEQTQLEQNKENAPTQLEHMEVEQQKQKVETEARSQRRTATQKKPTPAQPKRMTRSRARLLDETTESENTSPILTEAPSSKPSIEEKPVLKESVHTEPVPKELESKELVTKVPVPEPPSVEPETSTAKPEPSLCESPISVRRSTRIRKPTAIALEQKAQQAKPRVSRKRGKKQEELADTIQKEMKDKVSPPTLLPSSVPPALPQSPTATIHTESLQAAVSLVGKEQPKEQPVSAEESQKRTNTEKPSSLSLDKRKQSESELQRRARRKAESDAEIKEILDGFPSLSRYYQLLHRAGSGTFSRVYKAKDLLVDQYMPHEQKDRLAQALGKTAADMKHVAIKVILDISTPARVANEIECLLKLRSSPGVTPLITAFRNEAVTYVVLPYIDFDPFEDFYATMTLADARSYISELLIGLQSAHEQGIAHRDVKPGNFLYSKTTRLGYLADFGLARKTCPPSPSKHDNSRPFSSTYPGEQAGYYIDDTRPSLHADRSGTRGFRAPELLMRYKHQTTAVDIWAVGVILLIILSGQYPFFEPDDDADGIMELAHVFGMKKLKEFVEYYGRNIYTNIPSIPEDEVDMAAICYEVNKQRVGTWDPEEYKLAIDLMKKCLQLIHTNRLTATEALNHPFLKTVT